MLGKFKIYLLLLLLFPLSANAQTKQVNELLSKFSKELQPGETLDEGTVLLSITENLPTELGCLLFYENFNESSDKRFCEHHHPIAYFKRTEDIVVFIYSAGEKGNAMFHAVGLKSFSLKRGRAIDELPLVESFNTMGNSFLSIRLNEDGSTLVFTSTMVYADEEANKRSELKVNFLNNGKINNRIK